MALWTDAVIDAYANGRRPFSGVRVMMINEEIMTVSKERLTERLGLLSPDELHAVEMAMRIQLGLAA